MMETTSYSHIDLFSGIGGFALAASWAGFETEVFCEKEKYCQAVLIKRFGAYVTDSERVRKLQSERVIKDKRRRPSYGPPIIPEIRDFDGKLWKGATVLTGGFPCQPFSQAGKRRGKEDNRYLWPEMLRVINEARPYWVLGENVTGIINMELGTVLADLEGKDYEVQAVTIPAVAVNTPHRRDRVWIIAHDIKNSLNSRNGGRGNGNQGGSERPLQAERPNSWGLPWFKIAACFCRVDDGLPPWIYRHRAKRLKALGNAIVPQVAYEILKGIMEIERESK